MSLSDKKWNMGIYEIEWYYPQEDVKEFIKKIEIKPLAYCKKCKSFKCYAQFHEKVLLVKLSKIKEEAGKELSQ